MVELKDNERIDYMYSDDLRIIQDKTAFSFSMDTLLLAYWAKDVIVIEIKWQIYAQEIVLLQYTWLILIGHIMMQLKFKMKYILKLSVR